MALRAHIVIPQSHPTASLVTEELVGRLSRDFGGASAYDGEGAWISEEDEYLKEDHVRVVVTHTDEQRLRNRIVKEAEVVKERLDEEAVLIEFEEVEMKLV